MSVPIAMSTRPSATATADPELDPPEMDSGRRLSRTAMRAPGPTRPVASWSRLVVPSRDGSRGTQRCDDGRVGLGDLARAGTGCGGGGTRPRRRCSSPRGADRQGPPAASDAAWSSRTSSRVRRCRKISGRSGASSRSKRSSTTDCDSTPVTPKAFTRTENRRRPPSGPLLGPSGFHAAADGSDVVGVLREERPVFGQRERPVLDGHVAPTGRDVRAEIEQFVGTHRVPVDPVEVANSRDHSGSKWLARSGCRWFHTCVVRPTNW